MTDRLQQLLMSSFDYCAQRTTARLEGLTDEELLWEPAVGEPPVTTIAWRLGHVIWCLREHGLRAVAFEGGVAAWSEPCVVVKDAAGGLAALADAIEAWRRDLASAGDARLWELLGDEAGPYANDPVAAFVEHIHDELIHHSAEMALIRDLYQCSPGGPAPRS